MSTILDINKVDSIGINKSTGIVILKIFDDLDWENEAEHLYLLQNKINKYLNFIESGEILEVYPYSRNREICIDISFKEKLTENGLKFLEVSSKIISDAGFQLKYKK